MIKKLKLARELFKQGKVVSNPEKWKKGQITASVLVGFGALVLDGLRTFAGIDLQIPQEALYQGAVAIVAVVNVVCTYVSSDKVGIGVVSDEEVA